MSHPHKKSAATLPLVRCAIYTRKSTEEGLEQEFNSLDAQRESAEAFIRSQTATAPPPEPVRVPTPVDPRLPPPGTILTRPYKGQLVQVQVLTDGFAYAGRVYPSLSAVAKAVTGSHCNGYHFFRNTLNNKETL